MSYPNNMQHALTPPNSTSETMSYIPNNMAMRAIMSDEDSAYSNHRNLLMPARRSAMYVRQHASTSRCAAADIHAKPDVSDTKGSSWRVTVSVTG